MLKKKSKTKSSKKVTKRKSAKKVNKRKSSRRNPNKDRIPGEVFRQRHESYIDLSNGPKIPTYLAEDDSDEAEKIKKRIRKEWLNERGFKNSQEWFEALEKLRAERRAK